MVPQPMGPAHTRRDPADPLGTPNAASEEAELVIMGPKRRVRGALSLFPC
jgi:hypothetical protein